MKRDGFTSRLLLFMEKNSGLKYSYIKQLKQGVWLLVGDNVMWIVKEFTSLSKLKVQIAFTSELKRQFTRTYSIYPEPFILEKRIFGLIQYIKPHKTHKFNYRSSNNINEALVLLNKFHAATSRFTSLFQNDIPYFHQINKWERRIKEFNELKKELGKDRYNSTLQALFYTGDWALDKMNSHASYYLAEPHSIIHGDVAYHNFIRGRDSQLYLIDYDLIAIAPKTIDLIQFCNRILPSLKWNEEDLFKFPQLMPYREDIAFLAALVYPADIYREWNHFFRGKIKKQVQTDNFEKMIFASINERMQFYKKIMSRIDMLS